MKWVIETLVPIVMLTVIVGLLLAFLYVFQEMWAERHTMGK